MLTVLSILAVLSVLFVAAVVATREGPILLDAPVDMADVDLPDGPLQPEDLRGVRFALAVRGYRMDEVDRVIDRAAAELAERDERIAELERFRTAPVSAAAPPPAAAVVSAPLPAEAVDEKPPEPVTREKPAAPLGPAERETSDEPEPIAVSVNAEESDREPVASLLAADSPEDAGDGDVSAEASVAPGSAESDSDTLGVDGESAAASDIDASEPPPPPVEVAVVPIEVAPLPETAPRPAGSAPPSDDDLPEDPPCQGTSEGPDGVNEQKFQ